MPKFQVTLSGQYSETWEIEASTPEEAKEKVRRGGGDMAGDGQWDQTPEAVASQDGSIIEGELTDGETYGIGTPELQAYADRKCPKCGADGEFASDRLKSSQDGTGAYVQANCSACGLILTEGYTLTDITIDELGREKP